VSSALDQWAAAGLSEVTLPSGTRVKVALVSLQSMLRDGTVPQDLRALVLSAVVDGKAPATETEADRLLILHLQDAQTAASVRFICQAGEWQPVALSDLSGLPTADVEALQAINFRRMTPAEVTAASEGLTAAQEEAAETLTAWRQFRDGTGEPDRGGDGEPVRPTPIGNARHPRSRRGVVPR
jgi:hypothetical protein